MNKKGSMELSVNSIVILVIAVVMMGLILGFIKTKFVDLDKQMVNNEPEAQTATPGEQLTISRETIAVSSGEDVILKVQVYALEQIDLNLKPVISCSDPLIFASEPDVQGKDVPQGQIAKYTMKVMIPPVPKGKYLCLLGFNFNSGTNNLQKDLVIEVR